MDKFRSNCAVMVFAVLLPAAWLAAAAQLRGIYAEGIPADKSAWLLQSMVDESVTPPANTTQVWGRREGSPDWVAQPGIPFAITQVTHFRDDLVVLLESGQWLIVGQSTGSPLPDRRRIVALAGDDNALYAIAQPGNATTQASTNPTSVPTTAATTQSTSLSLYSMNGGNWKSLGTLPAEVTGKAYALGNIQSRPTIASVSDDTLRLWQLPPAGQWTLLGEQAAKAGLTPRRVLADAGRAFVYLSGETGPAQLLVHGDKWLGEVSLASDARIRDLAIAGGMIRFTFAVDQTIRERRLSARTLQVESPDTDLVLLQPWDMHEAISIMQQVDLALIAMVLIYAYGMRDRYQKTKIDWGHFQVSPIGKRAFAAMIDLVPVLVMLMYIRFQVPHIQSVPDIFASREGFVLLCASVAFYISHTAFFECVLGRSLGKMVTRLYVVNMVGQRPHWAALLSRNLLRVIDVTLPLTPLITLYLPLRQRLGDLAAGTIVLADREEENQGPDA